MRLTDNVPTGPQHSRNGQGLSHGDTRIELPLASAGDESAFSRRDFLKLTGFAIAGATFAGCQRASIHHIDSPLTPPGGFLPGVTYDYASTCGGCSAACGLLFKNRDGRPIKLEGNPEHPLSRGGLCAVGQASLLGLYDLQRITKPNAEGQPKEWPDLDEELNPRLDAIRKAKGAVRFLTGPGVGPTARAVIRQFLDTFADGRHVVHDPRSCSAILKAHDRTHGNRLLPHYHLDRAEVIVSFDADFLGTWISPVEFTAAYQARRRLEKKQDGSSYHVQFESLLTLTGSKADERRTVTPAGLGTVMNHLAASLAKKAGKPAPEGETGDLPFPAEFLDHLADTLWDNQKRSLILCGSQDVDLQILTTYLNDLLGNYGSTVDLTRPSYQRDDDDREVENLRKDLSDGKIAALFVYQSNPVYDLPGADRLVEDLKRVKLIVSLSPRRDETTQLAHFVCPDHHYLESWSDAEPVNGVVSLFQPAINPLHNTRSILESLLAWMGKTRTPYEVLREYWEKKIYPRDTQKEAFVEFWERTLQQGYATVAPRPTSVDTFKSQKTRMVPSGNRLEKDNYSLILYSKVGMPDASHAYNPWLHELPDPISKITWDNYACVSPATAEKLGLVDGDMIRLQASAQGNSSSDLELPVLVQPGQHHQVVGVALGYGSQLSKRFARIGSQWLQSKPTVGPNGMVGKNAAPLLQTIDGTLRFTRDNVRLTRVGGQHPLATTQNYNLLTVPPRFGKNPARESIIHETTLKAYQEDHTHEKNEAAAEKKDDLWPADHPETGIRWGMVIDLNACTGCSACVVACQVENNTPVVGKDEVRRHREMHWLRIDRYYKEQGGRLDVAHQPMLCQHCGNAPCEVVCPVLATVHGEEGLNQQVYNRCVGTRYCANNCPYKVRRFNWFDYAHDDLLENLVLNPDVTVRTRGVMEKCTFCVQRIQEAKRTAVGLGQTSNAAVVLTACQQSCPAQAISFGNLNDPKSRVSKLTGTQRSYQVLDELNVKPSVNYLALVRNRPAEGRDR
jgi:molybdopterin-containing oxidoreductase family iron-sulfur binding subunit